VSEIVMLDAVHVATIARAARDLATGVVEHAAIAALQMLPEPISAALHRHLDPAPPEPVVAVLTSYADELDEIAEAAVSLDKHDHEIEHQLRWWDDRVEKLQSQLNGHPGDDQETARELALFRGRVSGAQTMRRHYAQQRSALLSRHHRADADCAGALALD
jgi:hypothetical protein